MSTGLFWINAIVASIGSFIGWYLGGIDGFLYALIIFVAVDYLTGVMAAIHDRNLSSKIGAKGIFRKVMIFLLLGIAHMVDAHVIGNGSVFRNAVIFFYLSNEGISILENASGIGLPVPARLRDMLEKLYEEKGQAKEQSIVNRNWVRDMDNENMDGGTDNDH